MNKIKWSAVITMVISLLISIVSAYCTVVGMGNVFVSAAGVTMFIASVIELGRVILIYDLHHYWDEMKLHQKIPGVFMLLIAITLSAMGIFGFMSNAHSQRTQEVIPIEMEIKQKQSEIDILNNAIEINNQQIAQFDDKAYNRYTEMGYVTKAVNLQKEQQKVTNQLYDDNRQKQEEITKLNQEILQLQLDAEQKAPTLAHLKYYAKLLQVDNDTAIIIFIVMIMTVFDTLAMYLMITSDWIFKLDRKPVSTTVSETVDNGVVSVDNETLYNRVKQSNEQLIEMICNKLESSQKASDTVDFTPIYNAIRQDSDYQVESLKKVVNECNKQTLSKLNEEFIKLQNGIKDQSLVDKLSQIEKNLKDLQNISEFSQKDDKKIDKRLTTLIQLIDNNEEAIGHAAFRSILDGDPLLLKALKEHYKYDKGILNKLNKLK